MSRIVMHRRGMCEQTEGTSVSESLLERAARMRERLSGFKGDRKHRYILSGHKWIHVADFLRPVYIFGSLCRDKRDLL